MSLRTLSKLTRHNEYLTGAPGKRFCFSFNTGNSGSLRAGLPSPSGHDYHLAHHRKSEEEANVNEDQLWKI